MPMLGRNAMLSTHWRRWLNRSCREGNMDDKPNEELSKDEPEEELTKEEEEKLAQHMKYWRELIIEVRKKKEREKQEYELRKGQPPERQIRVIDRVTPGLIPQPISFRDGAWKIEQRLGV